MPYASNLRVNFTTSLGDYFEEDDVLKTTHRLDEVNPDL